MLQSGVLELDLHGMNQYQATMAIDSALRRSRPGTYRLRLIHGHNSGSSLKDMIRQRYAVHPKVLRMISPHPGATELVLREY